MKRVYVISEEDIKTDILKLSNSEFIKIATFNKKVYTLIEFQVAFNNCEINSEHDYIRII